MKFDPTLILNVVVLAGTLIVGLWRIHRCLERRLEEISRRLGGLDTDKPFSERLTLIEDRLARVYHWFENILERRERER